MSDFFLFALAKAQWDCGDLENDILYKVETIIKSENEIDKWKNQDASEEFINDRKESLNDLLSLIKSENKTVKRKQI
jgi:hypothetical protein